MSVLTRACILLQKPAQALLFLVTPLEVFASGRVRLALQAARWPLLALIVIAIVIVFTARRSARQLQEIAHV